MMETWTEVRRGKVRPARGAVAGAEDQEEVVVEIMLEEGGELPEIAPGCSQVIPRPTSMTAPTQWSWSVRSSLSSLQWGS